MTTWRHEAAQGRPSESGELTMADEPQDQAAQTPAPPVEAQAVPKPGPRPTPPQPKDEESLGDPGKRALDAERARAKAAEQKAAALQQQLDELTKTAEERAAEALETAKKAAIAAEAKALRYEVAAEKGVPLGLAARLSGATRDEIAADADELLKLIPQQAAPKPPVPKPDPSVGATGNPKPLNLQDAIASHYT